MKSEFSGYLASKQADCEALVSLLDEHYDYASILATDVGGTSFSASRRQKAIREASLAERGFVARVYKNGCYSEYSFNIFEDVRATAEKIIRELDAQLELLEEVHAEILDTPKIEEEIVSLFEEKEVEMLPSSVSFEKVMEELTEISNKGLSLSENLLECMCSVTMTKISKMFISHNKKLKQSYIISEGMIGALGRKGSKTQMDYQSYSGLKGAEILKELENGVERVVRNVEELLDAGRVEPGEYDIICTPEVAGLIAHEAFGHGVEMDMFVKNRALAKEYMDKRVASDLVDMHDGALTAQNTSSYVFDDEGTVGQDTVIIHNGILKGGLADMLSALRLNVKPTGNGKRQSFERKAYARMTNTVFMPGKDTLEEMIKSIKHGYYLEGMQSGMEDPKHWGIQCMLTKGREIKGGKFTGTVVSPVIMTGYVPDLLKSITMVSDSAEVFGSGMCGKGYKEWVKVSDGGPYLKAKGRLG